MLGAGFGKLPSASVDSMEQQEEKTYWEMLPTVHCACPSSQFITLN